MIKSTLNWLDLISIEKNMADNDNWQRQLHFLSWLQFAKDKSKYIWKYLRNSLKYVVSIICLGKGIFLGFYFDSFELLKWKKEIMLAKKYWRDTMILLFMSAITSGFVECCHELERLHWVMDKNQSTLSTNSLCCSALLCFTFVSYRLVNESELEWFLLIICK